MIAWRFIAGFATIMCGFHTAVNVVPNNALLAISSMVIGTTIGWQIALS